jgi:drug/metabolite transporter (DMT)-like permease
LLAGLGSALCLAQAAVLVRRLPPVHPVTMNALGMTTGATLLLASSWLVGEEHVAPHHSETWLAVGYLVAVGSVVVFVLFLVVLRHWAASRAAHAFVIITVVSIVLSAWLDDEVIRADMVLGGLLVLTGVYVGALRRRQATSPPTSTPADAT